GRIIGTAPVVTSPRAARSTGGIGIRSSTVRGPGAARRRLRLSTGAHGRQRPRAARDGDALPHGSDRRIQKLGGVLAGRLSSDLPAERAVLESEIPDARARAIRPTCSRPPAPG